MFDFEQIQGGLNSLLVIIVVSVVIGAAWLSTYVREHPLIATIVVLQPTTTASQDTNNTSGNANPNNSPGNMDNANNERMSENSTAGAPQNEKEDANINNPSNLNGTSNSENTGYASYVPENSSETNGEHFSNVDNCAESVSRTLVSTERESDEDFSIENSESETIQNLEKSEIEEMMDKDVNVDSANVRCRIVRKSENDAKSDENVGRFPEADVVSESQENFGDATQRPVDSIRIRLKFLDETQRLVYGLLNEPVIHFKRTHFAVEIETHRIVRLIFNGRLLNQEMSTLGQYGLFDNCVVHCHVSQPQPPSTRPVPESTVLNAEDDDVDLSDLLVPSLFVILIVLWWVRYEYGHLFNTSATIIMVFLTLLLLISQYAFTITLNISLGSLNNRISSNSSVTNELTNAESHADAESTTVVSNAST